MQVAGCPAVFNFHFRPAEVHSGQGLHHHHQPQHKQPPHCRCGIVQVLHRSAQSSLTPSSDISMAFVGQSVLLYVEIHRFSLQILHAALRDSPNIGNCGNAGSCVTLSCAAAPTRSWRRDGSGRRGQSNWTAAYQRRSGEAARSRAVLQGGLGETASQAATFTEGGKQRDELRSLKVSFSRVVMNEKCLCHN